MPESRVARADRRAEGLLRRTGEELRTARLAAGSTMAQVAAAVGISSSEVSRIERGQAGWVDLGTLSRMATMVGLDLWMRTYPCGEPLRDIGQLRLGEAFVPLVGAPLVVRSEVGIGDPRDQRAWDMTITDPVGDACGVELETRFSDAQAQHRRIARKLDDSGLGLVVVVVVADTRANRSAVRAAASMLGAAYVIDDRAAVEALRVGRLPPRSALIFVPVPRTQTTGSARATSRSTAPREHVTVVPAPRESG
jgi:transcriptional regulator with XRE-family HTH domain